MLSVIENAATMQRSARFCAALSARRLFALALLAAGNAFFAETCLAATITVNHQDARGRTFIDVVGKIELHDDILFSAKAAGQKNVVVTLVSPGGKTYAAIKIGEAVRENGMTTYVPADGICASACAIIWLAGKHRAIDSGAGVAFHSSYDVRTGQRSGLGNALVGAYLTKLGFGEKTVHCTTEEGPNNALWLTAKLALKCDIKYEALNPPRAIPVPSQPSMSLPQIAQPARPAPPPASKSTTGHANRDNLM
jgi:hypothetical protein